MPSTGRAPRIRKNAAKTLITTLFTVNGPLSKKTIEQWLGTGPSTTSALWKLMEDDLSEVWLEGRKLYAPNEILTAMQSAADPRGVVFLPPNDAYLRQTDRTLLMPNKEQRQQIFKSLSGPGALVTDGEVSGSWRYRKQDGIIIQPFRQLHPRAKSAAQEAAERLTDAMDMPLVSVSWN